MDGGDRLVEIRILSGMDRIDAQDWDACAAPEMADGGRALSPFTTHRFLLALEQSGSAATDEGWAPHHLVASIENRILGVMPLYLKGHSQGEYVFDHSWAHAWERAGGEYYPKLQSAVPFTPATGPRMLVRSYSLADSPVEPDTVPPPGYRSFMSRAHTSPSNTPSTLARPMSGLASLRTRRAMRRVFPGLLRVPRCCPDQ